ncbi:hypothetical protein BDZ97DRAFT_1433975 [Flammula alnicola]|nr:hypothetical protein BDZ97DRAFT_1433975 [Flammula alnicola]
MERKWFCNCLAHCTRDPARPKEVSRSTWFAHRAYRNSEATAHGQPAPHTIASTSATGVPPSSRPRSRDSSAEPTERPPKITRVHGNDADANLNDAGAPNIPQMHEERENTGLEGGSEGEGMDLDCGGGDAGDMASNLVSWREDDRNKPKTLI